MASHNLPAINTQPGHSWFPFSRDIFCETSPNAPVILTVSEVHAPLPLARPKASVILQSLLCRPAITICWGNYQPQPHHLASEQDNSTSERQRVDVPFLVLSNVLSDCWPLLPLNSAAAIALEGHPDQIFASMSARNILGRFLCHLWCISCERPSSCSDCGV